MFELTDDHVILTQNRTVITIMLYPGDTHTTMKERLKKYFPNPKEIKEEHLLETMLMWRSNPDNDSVIGCPLQTLYLTPDVNEHNEPIIKLLMRKRDAKGKAVHEDTDTIEINSKNVDAWVDELIMNFAEYHYFVVDFMIAQSANKPEVTV